MLSVSRLIPACASCLRASVGVRHASGSGWFDRLLPAEDAATTAFKARERALIKKKLGRSRFAEMLAADRDKVRRCV